MRTLFRLLLTLALLVTSAWSQGVGGLSGLSGLDGIAGDASILFRYSAGDSISALGGTFARASTATYRDSNGVLQTAASGAIRDAHYEWDPVKNAYVRTLLLEGQRTNLALQSEAVNNTPWVIAAGSVTANATSAPDGVISADKLVEASADGHHGVQQSITLTVGTVYTLSVFAKKGERSWLRLPAPRTATETAWFDLQNGVVGTVQSGVTSASITPLSNNWYRCTIVFTADLASPLIRLRVATANNSLNYLGDGASGIYVWGVQLDAGSFASSYIPTTSATVTRAADDLTFPISFNPQEMSMYGKMIDLGALVSVPVQIGTGSNSSSTRLQIRKNTGTTYASLYSTGGSNIVAQGATVFQGQIIEHISRLKASGVTNAVYSVNGSAETVTGDVGTLAIASSWSSNIVALGGIQASGSSFTAFRDIIIAKGTRDLSWMRSRVLP